MSAVEVSEPLQDAPKQSRWLNNHRQEEKYGGMFAFYWCFSYWGCLELVSPHVLADPITSRQLRVRELTPGFPTHLRPRPQ